MKTEIDQYVIDKELKLRKEQHLSQNDLASFIEVPKSFISAVENPRCRAKYNIFRLNEIEKNLNCKFSDFPFRTIVNASPPLVMDNFKR